MSFRKILKAAYLNIYRTGIFNFIPDNLFIPFQYRMATGKKLNLDNPVTYDEKLQWIKLYDRNPLYPIIADKFRVREFVAEKIGDEYLIPLLGVWNSPDEIDIASLPSQFVIKCNHDSGGIAICHDKAKFNWQKEKKKIQAHFSTNYYTLSREWAYKDIKPCIIAEKFMQDDETQELRDYKFFCFNGEVKYIQVDFDRFTDHRRNIYNLNWELVNLTIKCPNDPARKLKKPENFDEMIELASKLSKGFPELRVDLYSVNGHTYFGELTIYHGSGFEKFTPETYNEILGSYIDLSLCRRS